MRPWNIKNGHCVVSVAYLVVKMLDLSYVDATETISFSFRVTFKILLHLPDEVCNLGLPLKSREISTRGM